MNEQLQNALAEIITSALENAEAAKGFVLAELPDVVQQVLAWHFAVSLIWFVLGAVTLAFLAWAWISPRGAYRRCVGDEFGEIFVVAGTLAGLMVGLLGVLNITWLQIWLAPKVYLIEYAASLVK